MLNFDWASGNLSTDMLLNLSSTDPVTKPKRCHRRCLLVASQRNILFVTDRHCKVLQNRTLGERALLFSNNPALPRSVCIKGSDTKALNKANVVKSVNWVDRLSTDWWRYHSTRLLTLGITEYFCIYYRCRSKNLVMENRIDLSIRCLRY